VRDVQANRVFNIRLTEDKRARLESMAKQARLSFPEYAGNVILRYTDELYNMILERKRGFSLFYPSERVGKEYTMMFSERVNDSLQTLAKLLSWSEERLLEWILSIHAEQPDLLERIRLSRESS
jgi:hypothetical protein